jgi:hypothetical protein
VYNSERQAFEGSHGFVLQLMIKNLSVQIKRKTYAKPFWQAAQPASDHT